MRVRLLIAYDGKPFAGWQSQREGNTVQDHLEKALATVAGKPIRLHGSGRTDTGVHALGQCAHADVPDDLLSPSGWMAALNGNLPHTIRVLRSTKARPDFHARFSARGKIYRYRIWNESWMHPLELGRAWHVPGRLEHERLREALQILAGKHDFAAFAANRGGPPENAVRTLHRVKTSVRGPLITLEFEGDGFLYKMVRLLTGSAIHVARGRSDCDWLRALLSGKSPRTNRCAPAEGLYLWKVLYDRTLGEYFPKQRGSDRLEKS